ncbi:hypothetical protein SLEP1_g2561 [Rubroshorea leprosula]|uniref:Uncharacterized protein n=1 Tax=Rubroshorea leprosula TaxID=152421 RepID=A0AAV5HI02_9ROSI|nr:hypothetical protein SLEP1_g2561 [Rubroshorea leprosula]
MMLQKLKQKIRHFECLAKVDPTNLEELMDVKEEEGDNNDAREEETDDVEEKAK